MLLTGFSGLKKNILNTLKGTCTATFNCERDAIRGTCGHENNVIITALMLGLSDVNGC